MRIDGRGIAEGILTSLKKDVNLLKEKGVTPNLAVILIGDNPASVSYIKQKQKAAEIIGAKLMLNQLSPQLSPSLESIIKKYNEDPAIHGIIIQRPLPKESRINPSILDTIDPRKDVDGFVPNSLFDAPVAMAVMRILDDIGVHLKDKHIVVIGRGETAGTPIARTLIKRGFHPAIVHSQTPNPHEITKLADILISCVGKKRVVKKEAIKRGVILIGVGMHREDDGKFHGDYDEEEIKDVASYYTPTPRGVGPVNVACLMKNLVKACIMEGRFL